MFDHVGLEAIKRQVTSTHQSGWIHDILEFI